MRKKDYTTQKGLTFFEMLVAVSILASGMVMIYKGLLLSVDIQEYLMHRLYAGNLLEQKIGMIQRDFQDAEEENFLIPNGETQEVVLNNKPIAFQFSYDVRNLGNLKKILQLDVILSWVEHGRSFSLTRSAYVSQF